MNIIIILGKSGIGKTTLEKKLIKHYNVTPVTIYTIRDKRDDDPDYYKFISKDNIKDISDRLIYTIGNVDDYWYGYSIDDGDLLKDNVTIVVSFINSKDAIKFKKILIDYIKNKYNILPKFFIFELYSNNKDIAIVRDRQDIRDKNYTPYPVKVHRDFALNYLKDMGAINI